MGAEQPSEQSGLCNAEAILGGIGDLHHLRNLLTDAMAIHLNPLQEVSQPGGDSDWHGVADAIARLIDKTATQNIPIYVEEDGAGLSGQAIERLYQAGVHHVELAEHGKIL